MGNTCIRALADQKQITRCKKHIDNMEKELTQLSSVVGLIGNETRLKILHLLMIERRLCVCDLSDILEISVPAISQQLRKLKDGGVINSQREGTVIYYSISDKYQKLLTGIIDTGLHKIQVEA